MDENTVCHQQLSCIRRARVERPLVSRP
jgi:hypothetical protein